MSRWFYSRSSLGQGRSVYWRRVSSQLINHPSRTHTRAHLWISAPATPLPTTFSPAPSHILLQEGVKHWLFRGDARLSTWGVPKGLCSADGCSWFYLNSLGRVPVCTVPLLPFSRAPIKSPSDLSLPENGLCFPTCLSQNLAGWQLSSDIYHHLPVSGTLWAMLECLLSSTKNHNTLTKCYADHQFWASQVLSPPPRRRGGQVFCRRQQLSE